MGISVNATLYFDKVPRAKTLQMLTTFAYATYMFEGDKESVVKHLGAFLDVFKSGGKGSYNGETKQFNRQYTCGRHLGIWQNESRGSDLILTNLAKKMVEGKITPEYYLSTILLNLNEIIEKKGRVVNPLYSTLKYMKDLNIDKIKKEDINNIDDFALEQNENEFRNIWYSLLYSSAFFLGPNDDNEIVLNSELGTIDDFIRECNISLITDKSEEINNIKEKYNSQKNYTDFLTKENNWLKTMYFTTDLYIERPIHGENNTTINLNLKGINKIISGAPGTGKSKMLDKEYYEKSPTTSKRITFHPEYTYNDFVGYIRPITKNIESENSNTITELSTKHIECVAENSNDYETNKSSHITYDFVPGPFTEILCEAMLNNKQMYNLIIEEINRANAAAVFGDLFQLLDRDSDTSISEYSVHNRDIYEYIRKKFETENKVLELNNGQIVIPNNLNIIATMNTADQNVFIMDTAFKRRWEFEYMDIDFVECKFRNSKIKALDIEWERFVRAINKFMMSIECSDLMIPEDKQIGPFFIKEKELQDNNKFAYKVLMYLWDDVFKMERERIFNVEIRTFSQVVNIFKTQNAMSVFNEDIRNILKDKDYVKEYMQISSYEELVENETPEEGDIYEDR